MGKQIEEVTYDFEDGTFKRDFVNLFYRMNRLEDHILAYMRTGNAHFFVDASIPREGYPKLTRATFDRIAATRFENRVIKLLSTGGYLRAMRHMPVPNFPVRLVIMQGEMEQTATYSFGGDEELVAFCKEVSTAFTTAFRMRFQTRTH